MHIDEHNSYNEKMHLHLTREETKAKENRMPCKIMKEGAAKLKLELISSDHQTFPVRPSKATLEKL